MKKRRFSKGTRYLTAAVAIGAFASIATAGDIIYSSSFESDGGGWTASGVTGDWERGIPSGAVGPSGGPEPVGGNTGDYVWGTVIGGGHSPNGDEHLTQTFDFSNYTGVKLNYYEWLDSGGNSFDMARTLVNGNEELLADGGPTNGWRLVTIDLGAYDGMSSVEIDFNFISTGVVERVGWYIDDVSIEGTAIPSPGALALLGLAGLASRRRRRS